VAFAGMSVTAQAIVFTPSNPADFAIAEKSGPIHRLQQLGQLVQQGCSLLRVAEKEKINPVERALVPHNQNPGRVCPGFIPPNGTSPKSQSVVP